MFIKEIELNNFRIYKGRNVIHLMPKEDKNIVIVSGKNGFGKTTFLMSLVWCLYGKQMERVDELYKKEIADKGGYAKYIGNSLNRLAANNGESKFSVSVTFTDVKVPDITCNEVKITRSYNISTSANERLEILIDGAENQIMNDLNTEGKQDGEEVFIRSFILPIEIAKFFFFDAEKIVSLSEMNNSLEQRKTLSRAYTEVLGIKKYEDSKEQLEIMLDDFRKKSANAEDRKELNQINASIENKQIEIQQNEEKIDEIYQKQVKDQKESEEIQIKLVESGDLMSVDQLNEYKITRDNLEEELKKLQEELKDLFDLIPFGLSGEQLAEVSRQLESEKNYRENKYKQENVGEKINLILNDLEESKKEFQGTIHITVRDFYEEQIKNLIKKHFFAEVIEISELFSVLHDFSDTETNELNQHINTLKNSFKTTLNSLNDKYSRMKNELGIIQRKINNAEKNSEDDYISELRKKREILEKNILEFQQNTSGYKQKIEFLKEEIKMLKQNKEKLRKKIDESLKHSEKEKLTKSGIVALEDFIRKFKTEAKEKMQKNILDKLNKMMHKKEFIEKVSVDINQSGDDVDIKLHNKRNEIIDRSTFSMGERQLYASALLKALVDESDIEFPVFIDSPMQKLDKDHAESIIKEFYPSVSKQVVVLPLIDTELNQHKYDLLKSKVSKAYLIHNETIDASKFIETEPEHLIQKYDELYAN